MWLGAEPRKRTSAATAGLRRRRQGGSNAIRCQVCIPDERTHDVEESAVGRCRHRGRGRGSAVLAMTSRRARSLSSIATSSSSGSSRSSRSTSTSPSSTPRRSGTRRRPGAKVIYASGKSGTDDAGEIAAIQNMVAQGVKGIAITPTSPAVSAALDKAIKAGVKVVLMDNDIPKWKKKSSVVATNNFKGGELGGQVPRHEAQGRRHARRARGQPRAPALVDRVTGML